MKASAENYKGIEFVRISSLPEDQKQMLVPSNNEPKVIRILRDKELLNDCIQYHEYTAWYLKNFKVQATPVSTEKPKEPAAILAEELRLAFK